MARKTTKRTALVRKSTRFILIAEPIYAHSLFFSESCKTGGIEIDAVYLETVQFAACLVWHYCRSPRKFTWESSDDDTNTLTFSQYYTRLNTGRISAPIFSFRVVRTWLRLTSFFLHTQSLIFAKIISLTLGVSLVRFVSSRKSVCVCSWVFCFGRV